MKKIILIVVFLLIVTNLFSLTKVKRSFMGHWSSKETGIEYFISTDRIAGIAIDSSFGITSRYYISKFQKLEDESLLYEIKVSIYDDILEKYYITTFYITQDQQVLVMLVPSGVGHERMVVFKKVNDKTKP